MALRVGGGACSCVCGAAAQPSVVADDNECVEDSEAVDDDETPQCTNDDGGDVKACRGAADTDETLTG